MAEDSELFSLVWPPGAERRSGEWRKEVGKAIRDACEKLNRLPGDFSNDDTFLDAVARATQAALKDHRREKWELLRNGIVGSVSPPAPDGDLQQVFFQLLDELTLSHIAILRAVDGPYDPALAAQSTVEAVKRRLGKTAAEEPMLRAFLDQLQARGLLRSTSTRTPVAAGPLSQTSFTEVGTRFLRFISRPVEPAA